MGLLATQLEQLNATKRCKYAAIVVQLDDEDMAALDRAIVGGASYASLASALTNAGYEIHTQTVSDHLNGRCRCPR